MTLAVATDVPLAGTTTLGVGGCAQWLCHARDASDVAAADAWSRARGVSLTVIGGGSNLVVADRGVEGLVVRVAVTGLTFESDTEGGILRAGAGEVWDGVVQRAVEAGWAGVECLSGIPGTVGGTPIQNVGAYGQEVASSIVDLEAYDRREQDVVTLRATECGFGYRRSRFKDADAQRFVVCRVGFRFSRAAATTSYPDVARWLRARDVTTPTLADVRRAVLTIRRGKGMVLDPTDVDTRSVGSFFMNPVVSDGARAAIERTTGDAVPARSVPGGWRIPAAWLIERSGWRRGDGDGAVGLSTKHPLAIVNRGGATAAGVVQFAVRVKRHVVESMGVWLRPEPTFVGFGPDPSLDYLQAADG